MVRWIYGLKLSSLFATPENLTEAICKFNL